MSEVVEPICVDGVFMGWLGLSHPNSLLGIYEELPLSVQEYPWVLVASVDSGRQKWVAALFERAASSDIVQQVTYHPLADGCVVLDALSYRKLVLGDFFSHFDEVWFFAEFPREGPPEEVKITSEACITEANCSRLRKSIAGWVLRARPVLGLGDGVGLNFVTTDATLSRTLFLFAR